MNTQSQFVDFKKVKAQVSISDLLSHYGLLESLKQEPTSLAGNCPFCESANPRSFRASTEKNLFNCLSCKTGGNVLDFVMLMEDCTIRPAAMKLVEWFDLDPGSSDAKPSRSKRIPKKPEDPDSGEAPAPVIKRSRRPKRRAPKQSERPLGFELNLDSDHEWFSEMEIDPETVAGFGIGFCSKGVLANCIAFPVHDESSQLAGYVGYDLSEPESDDEEPYWKIPPQLTVKRLVYNLHRTDPSGEGELVLADDPLDLVLRWQDGERRLVCLLDGTISAAQVKLLESLV